MRFGLRVVVTVMVAVTARADEARAKVLFQAGTIHYEQGEYDKALEEFEAAYRLAQRPALLYNVAQCHDRLGNLDATIDYVRRYLDAAPDAPDRSAVESWLRSLEQRQREQRERAAAKPAPAPAAKPALAAAPPPAVRAESEPAIATPLHRRWWVWAGAGAVVVGAVVAAIVIGGAGGGGGDGSLPDGDGGPIYDVPYP